MLQELEIKLTVSAAALIQAHNWLLARGPTEARPPLALVNRYYDTPSADIKRHRAALRMRDTGDGFIQTLKTQGEFVNGAQRRQEWEWPLSTRELDLQLLAETPLGQWLKPDDLAPVFETNFQRRVLILDDGQARIECAFDDGYIEAGDRRRPLHEVELELKSGDESRLLAWARSLAEEVPMFLNLVSKAEQGYELAGLGERPAAPPDDPVEALFRALSLAWLKGEDRGSELSGLLDRVRSWADARGVLDHWQWLKESLSRGHLPTAIFEDRRLGYLQLALIGAR